MQVVVDGLMTQYERTGSGRTVLLLHGWGDSHATFTPLIKMLAGGFEVIAPDLPGMGKTSPPKNPWDMTDYAVFVGHFLEKIGAEKVYAIVGHSNGGGIAIRGLADDEFSSQKLALLASAGIRGEYKGRVKAIRLMTKAGKALTKPLPKSAKKRLRRTVYETVGSDMLVAEHLQETFKRVVTDDVQNDAPRVSADTLLIYGDKDTATPARYGERFRELIPKARLEIIAGAGHFIHHDKEETVNTMIAEFLQ